MLTGVSLSSQVYASGAGPTLIPQVANVQFDPDLDREAGCVLLGSKSIDDYVYHPGPSKDSDAHGLALGNPLMSGGAFYDPNAIILLFPNDKSLQAFRFP